MTLPTTFPISASQINVELGRASNAPFDIQGTEERTLAGIPTGPIAFSDFLGAASDPVVTYTADDSGSLLKTHTFNGVSFGSYVTGRTIMVQVFGFDRNEGTIPDTAGITDLVVGGVPSPDVPNGFWYFQSGTNGFVGVQQMRAFPTTTTGTVTFKTQYNHKTKIVIWNLPGSLNFTAGSAGNFGNTNSLTNTMNVVNPGTGMMAAIVQSTSAPTWNFTGTTLFGHAGPFSTVATGDYYMAWGGINKLPTESPRTYTASTGLGSFPMAAIGESLNP